MRETMSIWFFAGVMLLAYGVVIFVSRPLGDCVIRSAIRRFSRNCTRPSGGARCSRSPARFYTVKFWPRR